MSNRKRTNHSRKPRPARAITDAPEVEAVPDVEVEVVPEEVEEPEPEDFDFTFDIPDRRGADVDMQPLGAIVEWTVTGIEDENGVRYTRAQLKKSPPAFNIAAGDLSVSLTLTPRSTAHIQAALANVQHALAGTSPEPPKTILQRFMSLVDWCLHHRIRGTLLALFTLFTAYSVLAGFITLA